jgi:hypothetical protein
MGGGGHSHASGGKAKTQSESLAEMAAAIPDILSIFTGGAAKKYPVTKAYKIEEVPPRRRKDAKRIKIIYGPYTLRAANVCHNDAAKEFIELILI